jgi:hypothetical protein
VIGPAQIGMSCARACQQLRQVCCHFSAAWLIACESKYDTSGTCCAVVARVCVQALAAVEYPPGEAWGEDLLLALRPQLPSMEPHELIALMAALATLEVRGHSAMGVGCVWWGGVGGREHGVAAVLSLAPPMSCCCSWQRWPHSRETCALINALVSFKAQDFGCCSCFVTPNEWFRCWSASCDR